MVVSATLAINQHVTLLVQSVKDVKEGNRSRKPSKFNSIKDEVLYWKDTIEEIRRNNPELEKSIKDAKDTFVERKNNRIGQ